MRLPPARRSDSPLAGIAPAGTLSLLITGLLALAQAGCGYKGDLVLPDDAAKAGGEAQVDADVDAKPSAQED